MHDINERSVVCHISETSASAGLAFIFGITIGACEMKTFGDLGRDVVGRWLVPKRFRNVGLEVALGSAEVDGWGYKSVVRM